MDKFSTFPSKSYLDAAAKRTPEFMTPNERPYVLINEGYLDDGLCDAIIEDAMREEPYEFDHCNAITRELHPIPRSVMPVENLGFVLNELYWQFTLRGETAGWVQTYEKGGSYQLHMDGAPGQDRQMTAVVLLTDPSQYGGGDLEFHLPPHKVKAPRTRGTILLFPHWMLHAVTPIEWGTRQTLNLGFFGTAPRYILKPSE